MIRPTLHLTTYVSTHMQRSLIPCQINTVDKMATLHFNILKSAQSDVMCFSAPITFKISAF